MRKADWSPGISAAAPNQQPRSSLVSVLKLTLFGFFTWKLQINY